MIPLCREEGVGLMPWSPLAAGRLAGSREAGTKRATSERYREKFNRPEDHAVIEALRTVAAERGEPIAQVAIAWLLAKPGVTAPIIGASKASQLDASIRAVDASLSPEEMQRLEAPYVTQPLDGHYTELDTAKRLAEIDGAPRPHRSPSR